MINLLETCYGVAAVTAVMLMFPAVRRSRWKRPFSGALSISVVIALAIAWKIGSF